MYNGNVKCQLGCETEVTQEHCFECPFITCNSKHNSNVNYAHFYGTPKQQLRVTKEFSLLLEEMESLL